LKKILRLLLLGVVIVFLFNPVIKINQKININEKTAFLIDVSLSMKNHFELIEKIAEKYSDFDVYFFGKNFSPNRENLDNNINFTDIYGALNGISAKYENIFLISDGNHNIGSTELSTVSKIYSFGLGNEEEKFDIFVKSVDYEKLVYKNTPITFDFEIGLNGEKEIKAFLSFEKETIPVNLTQGNNKISVTRDFEQGGYSFRAGIVPSRNEAFSENNYIDIDFKVTEEILKCGIYSYSPDIDSVFINRILKNIGSTSINIIKEELKELDDEYDVLLNFGNPSHSMELIENFVNDGGLYFFFFNQNSDKKLKLPFVEYPDIFRNEKTGIRANKNFIKTPLLSVSENMAESEKVWNNIIFIDYLYSYSQKNYLSNDFLVDIDGNSFLSVISRGKGNIVLFFGGPLYRLSLQHIFSFENNRNLMEHVIKNIIQLYGARNEKIKISEIKKYYKKGEELRLNVAPSEDGNIKVIHNGRDLGNISEFSFNTDNPGEGRFEFILLSGGIERARKDFIYYVYENFSEFEKTTLDENLLRKISDLSDGEYFNINELDIVVSKLIDKTYEQKEIKIVHTHIFILFFLILFSFYIYYIWKN